MGIEHQVDDERHEFGEQRDAVVHLLAIDLAGMGGAAVHQLVAQHERPSTVIDVSSVGQDTPFKVELLPIAQDLL